MGGRGGTSGISAYTAAIPSDMDGVIRRLTDLGPALNGSQKQINQATEIRDNAQDAMIEAVMEKYTIRDNVLQEIIDGPTAMKAGVKKAYDTGYSLNGATIGEQWAQRRAKLYRDVSTELKKIDALIQSKKSAAWWINNRNTTMFREYIVKGLTIGEMEKRGYWRK